MFLSLNSWPKVIINDYRAVTFRAKDTIVKFVVFVNETITLSANAKVLKMLTVIICNPWVYLQEVKYQKHCRLKKRLCKIQVHDLFPDGTLSYYSPFRTLMEKLSKAFKAHGKRYKLNLLLTSLSRFFSWFTIFDWYIYCGRKKLYSWSVNFGLLNHLTALKFSIRDL